MRHSSDSVQSFLDTLTAVANTTTVQITTFFSTFLKHLKGLLSGMSCKTSTLSDFYTKPSEFSCGWNMQNKPPKASSISVLFCFENMRRDERLCSVFFAELSSREASRDVQWPYCVTLVLQLHADLSCFFWLPLLVHTDAHHSFSHVRCFCTVNKFHVIMLSTCTIITTIE